MNQPRNRRRRLLGTVGVPSDGGFVGASDSGGDPPDGVATGGMVVGEAADGPEGVLSDGGAVDGQG